MCPHREAGVAQHTLGFVLPTQLGYLRRRILLMYSVFVSVNELYRPNTLRLLLRYSLVAPQARLRIVCRLLNCRYRLPRVRTIAEKPKIYHVYMLGTSQCTLCALRWCIPKEEEEEEEEEEAKPS
ncbi:hypothetical protein PMIN01_06271 [Paraphaeosphaeria minitans]|uniref:Uncharacterized protein n=1 Tax=Paraphaeosphaeria minitans TaxID=565426 RepID=A0A9P6GL50_9PLEO|nr:hypothetical protein PMIN01_06271 [Paraphaeosphaeria minitans]